MEAPARLEAIIRATSPLNPDYTSHVGEHIVDPSINQPRWAFNGLTQSPDDTGVRVNVTPLIDGDDQAALMGYLACNSVVEAWVCERFPWLALTPVSVTGIGLSDEDAIAAS